MGQLMAYQLYRSSDLVTPYIVVPNDTVVSSATTISFIGKSLVDYGEIEQQMKLFMLENFANATSPINPITGQLWYDTAQSSMKVYNGTAWVKISTPIFSPSAPPSPANGDLWFNSSTQQLNCWNGSSWVIIGPFSSLSPSDFETVRIARTTIDATPSELWLNGSSGFRIIIPNNTTYTFILELAARRTDAGVEFANYTVRGGINNTSNNVTFNSVPMVETLNNTHPYSISVLSDNVNKALVVQVTGQAGKTIKWNGICRLIKVSN